MAALLKERITFADDLLELGRFFFEAPSSYDEKAVAKKWNDDAVKALSNYKERLTALEPVTATNAKEALQQTLDELGFGFGKAMPALRIAVTGAMGGPDMMEIIETIGQEETVSRIERAIATIA